MKEILLWKFQNSALYDHLKSAGYTDEDVESESHPRMEGGDTSSNTTTEQEPEKLNKVGLFSINMIKNV